MIGNSHQNRHKHDRIVASDPRYSHLKKQIEAARANKFIDDLFAPHHGVNNSATVIDNQKFINFSSYNYLALSGEKSVTDQAKAAIDRFGTSVSASRIVSGEIPLHRQLETDLANFIGVEDCLTLVSGHATNVTLIGHLLDKNDLVCHDALIHNSVMEGCRLSGAMRLTFQHNDCEHLQRLLDKHRHNFKRALIIVEGVYSMDGDIADLPGFLEIKKQYDAALMVDEAHSIGVLGKTGRGVSEHFGVDPTSVDILMGTLSKALASCGGYVAGSSELIEFLKFTIPGFVFSVGMPPSNAAASLAALQLLKEQPERLQQLSAMARLFLECARKHGLNTGLAQGTPIVPIILGSSERAVRLSQALRREGVSVHPIVYPAVEENAARVRFFIAADHTEEQIRYSVDKIAEAYRRLPD